MISRDERILMSFLKDNGGQPIGCLKNRDPSTRMFDAVTPNFKSVLTGKKLAVGTEVKLWKGEIVLAQ